MARQSYRASVRLSKNCAALSDISLYRPREDEFERVWNREVSAHHFNLWRQTSRIRFARHRPAPHARELRASWFASRVSCRTQTVGTVPPSMTYSLPVMDDARSDARNATNSATSSIIKQRPFPSWQEGLSGRETR